MATGWTSDRRSRQREAIRQWRSWERFTGSQSNGVAQMYIEVRSGRLREMPKAANA
jgi:hypothetical protein